MQAQNLLRIGDSQGKETIFELYGHLAKTYVLRDDETIIDYFDGGIRVANGTKDKNILFKRLLRYDLLCKIIHPEYDRIKFKELLDKSLDNLKGDMAENV